MADDEPAPGIPEWVVTFGDMMSLLLTFFIMLVSLSEMKNEEKYQGAVEAIQREFGFDLSTVNRTPGDHAGSPTPRADKTDTGRTARLDTMDGGDKTKAPTGDHSRVTVVRPGPALGVGTVITFADHDAADLDEAQRSQLDQIAGRFEGKPHLIAVAGHSSWAPPGEGAPHQDLWGLSYARARAVMEYLVTEHDIDRRRIRLQAVGPAEPVPDGDAAGADRVELFLLDETMPPVDDVEFVDR